MIIKSMSRKHPSFDQLIDYIESERKLKSRNYSIFHNVYSRNSEQLKNEFTENSKYLKFRKNGVYLYHEVISITKAKHIDEEAQKTILQNIVSEYLKARAKNNLAYAVLHEDKKDNFHFHIVISANEAQDSTRKRLSKADFAEIQTRLEKWVLEHYPELEQKAVFKDNQTEEQKQDRERKARISNSGAETKRRTGQTPKRDEVKETLETIFSNSTDGRDFTDRLHQAGFTLYQRGKQYGITDREGIKYRFSTLGLAEAWEALDKRMMENLTKETDQRQQKSSEQTKPPPETRKTESETSLNTTEPHKTKDEAQSVHISEHPKKHKQTQADKSKTETKKENTMNPNPFEAIQEAVAQPKQNEKISIEKEMQKRLEEIEATRKAKDEQQAEASHKNQAS